MFIVENHLGDLELEKKRPTDFAYISYPAMSGFLLSPLLLVSIIERCFVNGERESGMKKQIVSQKRQLDVVRTFMKLHKPILKTKS